MATKKTEVKAAEAEATTENALALPGIDWAADADAGMEGTDKESFATPFLRVLQKTSPQVDEGAAQVEGAKAGMFINSVTGEMTDGKEGVLFLPCAYERRFLRWAPRGSEPSFRGELLPDDVDRMLERGEVKEVSGRLLCPNAAGDFDRDTSDVLTDTRSHYGLLLNAAGEIGQRVLLTLSSTQIRKSKQLMFMLNSSKLRTPEGKLLTPPTWMNRVRITTLLESNDKGSWHGVIFNMEGHEMSQELYDDARSFHAALREGQAGANYSGVRDADGDVVAEQSASSAAPDSKEPF